jgi:hypothetical protein
VDEIAMTTAHAKKPIKQHFISPAEFVEQWAPVVRKCWNYLELDYSHKHQAVCVHDMTIPKAISVHVVFTNEELANRLFTEDEIMGRLSRILRFSPEVSNGSV